MAPVAKRLTISRQARRPRAARAVRLAEYKQTAERHELPALSFTSLEYSWKSQSSTAARRGATCSPFGIQQVMFALAPETIVAADFEFSFRLRGRRHG